MQRKEVSALFFDDFDLFLKENNLYDSFINQEIKCTFCSTTITKENVSSIYFDEAIRFCCSNYDCLLSLKNIRGGG